MYVVPLTADSGKERAPPAPEILYSHPSIADAHLQMCSPVHGRPRRMPDLSEDRDFLTLWFRIAAPPPRAPCPPPRGTIGGAIQAPQRGTARPQPAWRRWRRPCSTATTWLRSIRSTRTRWSPSSAPATVHTACRNGLAWPSSRERTVASTFASHAHLPVAAASPPHDSGEGAGV